MPVLQLSHEFVLSSRRVDRLVGVIYFQGLSISGVLFIDLWTIDRKLPLLDKYHRSTKGTGKCEGCGKEKIVVGGDKCVPENSAV